MSRSNTIVIGDYVVTRGLGQGSFAVVYKAHHRTTGQAVAIKAISLKKLDSKSLANLESEISILKRVRHHNIVRMLDIQKSSKYIYLILEYCGGGDLSRLIRKQGPLTEERTKGLMKQLTAGLHFLWANNLIHRDLKPQNLLLTSDKEDAVLKIADFGFARHLATASLAETLCGSPLYMAPEILRYQKYDAKADLWSVGAIMFEMLAKKPPFNGQNHIQLLANIEKQELRLPDEVVVSPACLQLLRGLLTRNPHGRISFEEYFGSAFVAGFKTPQQRVTPAVLDESKAEKPDEAAPGTAEAAGTRDDRKTPASTVVPPEQSVMSTEVDSPRKPSHISTPPRSKPHRPIVASPSVPTDLSVFGVGGDGGDVVDSSTAAGDSIMVESRTLAIQRDGANPIGGTPVHPGSRLHFRPQAESSTPPSLPEAGRDARALPPPPETPAVAFKQAESCHSLSHGLHAAASVLQPELEAAGGRSKQHLVAADAGAASTQSDEFVLVGAAGDRASSVPLELMTSGDHRIAGRLQLAIAVAYQMGVEAAAISEFGYKLEGLRIGPGGSVVPATGFGFGGRIPLVAVAKADHEVMRPIHAQALGLYWRSLSLFNQALEAGRTLPPLTTKAGSPLIAWVSRWRDLRTWLVRCFHKTLALAEACASRVSQEDTQQSPDTLIFSRATTLGAQAGVADLQLREQLQLRPGHEAKSSAEVYKLFCVAHQGYSLALLLLHALDRNELLSKVDKLRLRDFMTATVQRLSCLEELRGRARVPR